MSKVMTTALMFLAGAFAVCSAEPQHAEVEDVRVYYCHNLERVTMRVRPGLVEVSTAERTTRLAEVAASSPVRYSNGQATLSGVEEYVRFEDSGSTYWCRESPTEAPWEAARLRGIEFHAAGGDPEWSLDIDAGVAVEFATGHGTARVVTSFPAADLDSKSGRMTLKLRHGSHTLVVIAEPRMCYHAGSTMTLSVAVTFDATAYSGCGRRLSSYGSQSR